MSELGKILGNSVPSVKKQVAQERIRQTTTYGVQTNRYMQNKYGPKISSFQGEIDYNKTDDPNYIAGVANDALKHFGFRGNARVIASPAPNNNTDYYMIVDTDNIVAGYRVPGDNKKLGSTTRDFVESAILYKISRKEGKEQTADIADATGSIVGMKWKYKR